MQYLNPGPMTFGPPLRRRAEKLVVERGGPAAVIPKQHRRASGRHNKRLTQCFCAQMKTTKKWAASNGNGLGLSLFFGAERV